MLHADYPVYGSVAALGAAADAVVVGRVGGVAGRELDGGGDPETGDAGGIPLVFRHLTVQRVLAGAVRVGDDLLLSRLDLTKVQAADYTPLTEGQTLLLFLRHRSRADGPGVTSVNETWVPLSADNGVFDVAGSQARARSTLLTSVREEPSARSDAGHLRATLDEIAAALG